MGVDKGGCRGLGWWGPRKGGEMVNGELVAMRMPTQAQTLDFVRGRWPDRLPPIWRAGKCAEELGECFDVLNKSWVDNDHLRTEIAQLTICVMSFAESVGFPLWVAVAEEWALANERSWPDLTDNAQGKGGE
jgi:NTP pyrophosphatase (non-canonical NTP hydrolase)